MRVGDGVGLLAKTLTGGMGDIKHTPQARQHAREDRRCRWRAAPYDSFVTNFMENFCTVPNVSASRDRMGGGALIACS